MQWLCNPSARNCDTSPPLLKTLMRSINVTEHLVQWPSILIRVQDQQDSKSETQDLLSTHMVQETSWRTENICLKVVKILTLIWSSEYLYCVKRLSQLPILEQLIPVYILTFSGTILILYPSYRNYEVLNVRKRTTAKEVGPVSDVGNDSCPRHLLRRQNPRENSTTNPILIRTE